MPPAKTPEEQFLEFRAALTPQKRLDRIDKAIAEVFAPFEEQGLLDKLSQDLGPGNQDEIIAYPVGHPQSQQILRVSDVLIGDGTAIRDSLRRDPELSAIADRLFAWLLPQLKPTLTVDDDLTKQSMDAAARPSRKFWSIIPSVSRWPRRASRSVIRSWRCFAWSMPSPSTSGR